MNEYVASFLKAHPGYICTTIRKMDYAVKDDRALINLRERTRTLIEREPATAMERWGVKLKHIDRSYPPACIKELYTSHEVSEEILA